MTSPQLLILGLGVNLGERLDMLRRAVNALHTDPRLALDGLRYSSIYESPALLPGNAPAEWNLSYYNMAMAGNAICTPDVALHAIKQTERMLGREERDRWAPREIDIDLLAYGNRYDTRPALTLPHPGLTERAFAMLPLAEIAPQWRHPGNGKTAYEMATRFKGNTDACRPVYAPDAVIPESRGDRQ